MTDEENQIAAAPVSSSDSTTINAPNLEEHGYSGLATFMGECPEFAVYRRFGKLNSLNLLLLQAELVMLEGELKQQIVEDNASPDCWTKLVDKDFLMMSGRRPERKGCSKQYKTILRIRQVLRQYNREMLVQSQLDRLPRPNGRDLDTLRDWKNDTNKGCIYMMGDDHDIWETYDLSELQSFHAQRYDDAVSDWLTRYAVDWYHKWIGRHYKKDKKHSNMRQPAYSHKHIVRVVSTLTITLSSMFPVASICVLYAIQSFKARLLVIVGFTILFAAVVGAFSQGKRVETFAATMAFAAVQVVFISSDAPV